MILPIPGFFDPSLADKIWMIPYEERFRQALEWKKKHNLSVAARDGLKIGLLCIDEQNTFCLPNGQLFVNGQSGRGAVDDSIRLAKFIYSELASITRIYLTLDTHRPMQIFHPTFWVNENGEHPSPYTSISVDDVATGKWQVNPTVAWNVTGSAATHVGLQAHALHYVKELAKRGRYQLMIWPHHAMLCGAEHALVSTIFESVFFHSIARQSEYSIETKGAGHLTENYSVLGPEVLTTPNGTPIGSRNVGFIKQLLDNDILIIAGQAKSHCVAWTIHDLLTDINQRDPALAKKVYLLSDCSSSVVIPGVYDFTSDADKAFAEFEAAGMNLVKSTDPISSWKGVS